MTQINPEDRPTAQNLLLSEEFSVLRECSKKDIFYNK